MSTPIPKVTVPRVASKAISFTAFQSLWIPGTTKICSLGSNDSGFGVIQVHALSTSTPSSVSDTLTSSKLELHSQVEKKVQLKSGTFRASARSSSLPHLLAGDFEGRVGLWDLNRTEVPLNTFKAHDDVVNCMDGAGSLVGRPEFVTGCRDGTVRLWDTRQHNKEASASSGGTGGAGSSSATSPISNIAPTRSAETHDVWSVAMGGIGGDVDAANMLIAIGYDNGDVRVIDVRIGKPVFERNIEHGVCSLEFDMRQGSWKKLVATTLEGTIHIFCLAQGNTSEAGEIAATEIITAVPSGDESTLWQARHIPQRPDILAVTDGGGSLHVYRHGTGASKASSLGAFKVATDSIISLDFNEDLPGLFVGYDLGYNLRVGIVQF